MAGRLLAAAIASAQLLAARSLRVGATAPSRFNFSADFAACDQPEPCGPQGLQSHYLLDLLDKVEHSSQRVVAAGRTPTLLHIGAANLGNNARFADLDLYLKVNSLFPDNVQESYKLVLVEPNLMFFPELERNAKTLPIEFSQVKMVYGMVAESCKGNVANMYRFSRDVEHAFGIPYNVFGSWFSSLKTFPPHALRNFVAGGPYVFIAEQDFQSFLRFNNTANVSSYVEQVEVPCFTPETLLTATGTQPSDVAMVVVDAEQTDRFIVGKMLELPDFKPGYLQWEGTLNFPNQQRLGKKLQEKGFKVGGVYGEGNTDAANSVAVPAE